jgi:hypothetical protein
VLTIYTGENGECFTPSMTREIIRWPKYPMPGKEILQTNHLILSLNREYLKTPRKREIIVLCFWRSKLNFMLNYWTFKIIRLLQHLLLCKTKFDSAFE